MKRLLKAVVISLVTLATPVLADDCAWLAIGGPSKHTQSNPKDNESNYGLGWQSCLYKEEVRLVAQMFRNTHRVDSAAIGIDYAPWDLGSGELHIRPGMFAGAVMGYSTQAKFGILPTVAFEYQRFGIDYVLAKDLGKEGQSGFVHWLNFKVKIK